MSNTRKTTKQEKTIMEYLNDLRDSGITNMFGASPYIVNKFDIDKQEARKILTLWMDNFDEEGKYDLITIK